MKGRFGRPSRTPFALYDRESSSWKTSSLSLALASLPEPALIWPKQGMWDRGAAFELLTSGRLTSETDCSSSPLLPTPDAGVFNDGQSIQAFQQRRDRELAKGYNGNGGGLALAMMVRLLPTPRQSDGIRGQADPVLPGRTRGGQHIAAAVAAVHLLPTPTVGDSKNARNATANRSPDSRHHTGTTLSDFGRLLPTPKASDGDKGGPNMRGSKGDLAMPSAVTRIGQSTGSLSNAGPSSSDDPPPLRLF